MRYRVLAGVWAILWMMAGCWQPGDLPREKETSGRQESAGEVNPFTGQTIKRGVSGPALMVMVNNQPKARPQSGLNRADLVTEILAEGEITRFAAFYYGAGGGTVGPVRSVRPYYLDLAKGPRAVVAHAGGSPQALSRIREEPIPSLDGIHGDDRRFRREGFRKPPHNLYTDLSQLREGAAGKGYREIPIESPYIFARKEPSPPGKPATRIDLRYHRLYGAGYRYDRESGSYVRYTQGEKQVDRETGTPLTMENVLVVRAPHRVIDASGRREVGITGHGKGVLFRGGKAWPIHWEYQGGWVIPLIDGKRVPLLPGKTWINVLPDEGGLEYRG